MPDLLPNQRNDQDPDADRADLKKKAVTSAKGYVKYSGMAIQMIVILLLFVYGGRYLDANYGNDGTMYTAICALVGIGIALYVPLRSLLR